MELCRICVATDTKMTEIFDSKDINLMIQFCTGVLFTKEEGVPSKICTKCLEELHTAHKFKQKCLDSENIFKNTQIKKIKEEPDSQIISDDPIINNINDRSDQTRFDDGIDDFCRDPDLTDYDSSSHIKEEDVVVEKCVEKRKRVRKKNSSNEEKLKPANIRKKRGPYNKTGKPRLKKLKFRKLWCEACSIKFKTKQDSDDHKKQFHNEPQIWICEVCGKTFSYRTSHHSHMRSHYAPQFACDHCDYKSTAKHDLEKHVRIHTGHKSYICPVCACAYRTSSNLHSHVRLVHERVRRYACPLCARAFYDRTKLNRHVDSHNDVKRYSCEVCHACFSRRCYWKKHLQRQHDISVPAQRPGRRRGELRPLPMPAEA